MENSKILSASPLVSIVICTYNNAASLAITLQQIIDQEVTQPDLVELIVIDNNSSDNTADILKSTCCKKFVYRHYYESRQGISHARNTGFENALGDYILYTDDDADIPANWLENYLNKIASSKADCIFGDISIIWDLPQPWWYDNDRFQGFFAAINYGKTEFQVTSKNHPFLTKNACIKKSCLVEVGGFDPILGRKGAVLTGGEDILLFYHLIETEKIIHYCPDISIGHRLKAREYSEKNITNQFLACAKPIWYIAKSQPGKRLFKKPLGVLEIQIKDALGSIMQLIKAYLKNDRKELFYQDLRFKRSILVMRLWLLGREI